MNGTRELEKVFRAFIAGRFLVCAGKEYQYIPFGPLKFKPTGLTIFDRDADVKGDQQRTHGKNKCPEVFPQESCRAL